MAKKWIGEVQVLLYTLPDYDRKLDSDGFVS